MSRRPRGHTACQWAGQLTAAALKLILGLASEKAMAVVDDRALDAEQQVRICCNFGRQHDKSGGSNTQGGCAEPMNWPGKYASCREIKNCLGDVT